jgi:disulfide bond formation protein DsbB
MPRMDDLGATNRWTADRSSARGAATALLVQELRRGRILVLGGVLTVGLMLALLAAGQTEQDHDPLLAFLFSVALIGALVGCAIGISHWQRLRVMHTQLPPGLELEAQFGPDFLVVRRQWSESTLAFDGFCDVRVVHGWVLLRNRQTRVQAMLPQELFPPHDLARLRVVIAGYQPRDAERPEDTPGQSPGESPGAQQPEPDAEGRPEDEPDD